MNAQATETTAKKRQPAEKSAVQTAVDKAKAALEHRIALINDTARAQERVSKAEAKLSEEKRSYQASYEASLAAWTKSEMDDFGLRQPRRVSPQVAVPANSVKAPKKAARKTAAGDSAAESPDK